MPKERFGWLLADGNNMPCHRRFEEVGAGKRKGDFQMIRDFVWRTVRGTYQGKLRAVYEREAYKPYVDYQRRHRERGWRRVFGGKLRSLQARGLQMYKVKV